MFENGEYWAKYKERTKVEQIDNIHVYIKTFEKILTGKFYTSDETLSIEGVGKGKIGYYSGSPILEIKLDHVINDKKALGSYIYLNKVSSNLGPEGITKDVFCQQD